MRFVNLKDSVEKQNVGNSGGRVFPVLTSGSVGFRFLLPARDSDPCFRFPFPVPFVRYVFSVCAQMLRDIYVFFLSRSVVLCVSVVQ